MKANRLRNAEIKYGNSLQEWLTNPKNEDLPNEIVEPKINAAFNEFAKELLADEEECAEFISAGGIMDEVYFLPIIFDFFKSERIYEAIKKNCEVAFSHKLSTESSELEQARRELIERMEKQLNLN